MHSEALQDLNDTLRARGLSTRWDRDTLGRFLVVELEAPSRIAIVDFTDEEASGWAARHITLDNSADVVIREDPARDVPAMAAAVEAFVANRNRNQLADELARAIEIQARVCQPYAGAWSLLKSGEPGTWVMVAADWPGDDHHLVVASYPQLDQGVTTDGAPVTGWHVTVQGGARRAPYRVIYDAPENPDTRPMVSAVQDWLVGAPLSH